MYIHIHIHIYVCMYTYIYIYTYISYMPHTPMRVHSGPRDTDGARRCYPGRTLRKGAPVSGHRGHCLPLPRQQAWLASAASAEGLCRISKEHSRKGPIPEGAHRDLPFDRGHGQGETGGATALTQHVGVATTRMTSLGHATSTRCFSMLGFFGSQITVPLHSAQRQGMCAAQQYTVAAPIFLLPCSCISCRLARCLCSELCFAAAGVSRGCLGLATPACGAGTLALSVPCDRGPVEIETSFGFTLTLSLYLYSNMHMLPHAACC